MSFYKFPTLSIRQRLLKRGFDIIVSIFALLLTSWIIIITFVIASIDTKKCGFFRQIRVGRYGKQFKVIKLRTMRDVPGINTTVTTANDPRITTSGKFFRDTKLDELPQLINILLGQMSFVGPRPDVPGFADMLTGDDRIILMIRPGITGPATLRFRDEQSLLAQQENPEIYNREVIFPEKIRLNRDYIINYSFLMDLYYIYRTILD